MKTAYKKLLIVLSIIFLFSLSQKASFAQEGNIVVGPARQTVKIDPGTTKTLNIRFVNQSAVPLNGIFGVSDFIVTDEEGTPTFIDSLPGGFSTPYSASSWVTLPYQEITIPAKDFVTIQFKVEIPKDALAGGRYFGVYFEPGGKIEEKQEEISKEVGTVIETRIAGLVYLKVSGPVTENAFISRFFAPIFMEYGPLPLQTQILNRGNYHITPTGVVTVKNMFGKIVEEQILKEQNIFPDAIRIYENYFGKKWMIGKYTYDLTATYGEGGQVLTASSYTWVFPYKLVIIITLAIIIIILATKNIWKTLKKKQEKLEEKLEEKIEELEDLKDKFKDKLPDS
ncbi:DUF916 domain-containing protein, partial [Patescibacteria group bacterium]|nr:DUF916 domain-containing protein [Patescibacteria group bacterium]